MPDRDIDILVRATDGASRVLNTVNTNMNQVVAGAERLERVISGPQLQQAGMNMLQGFKTASRGLWDLVQPAIEIEEVFADIRKVTDLNPEGMSKLDTLLSGMSKRIPIAKTGLAEIASEIGRLGVKGPDELAGFTESIAMFATAWDIVPQAAGESVARMSNVFQIPFTEKGQQQLMKLGDLINFLADNTAAKAPGIVEALGRVGGVSRQFGLTDEKVAGLVAHFIAMGKPPEVAGRGIGVMLQKMQSATIQGKKFQQGLEMMGLNATALQTAIGKDANGALDSFLKKLASMDKQKRAMTAGLLFGQEWSDDIALITGNMDAYNKIMGIAGDETQYAGSVIKEFNVRISTSKGLMEVTKNILGLMSETIGKALIPGLKTMAEWFTPVVERITAMAEKHPELVRIAGAVAAISAAALGLGGAILYIGGSIKTILDNVTGLFGASGTLASMGPGGWIALGIAAVIALLGVMFVYWEDISGAVQRFWSWIEPAVTWTWENLWFLLGPLALVIKYWDEITDGVKVFWGWIEPVLSTFWEMLQFAIIPIRYLISHWGEFTQEIQKAFTYFHTEFPWLFKIVEAIGSFIKWLIGSVASLFRELGVTELFDHIVDSGGKLHTLRTNIEKAAGLANGPKIPDIAGGAGGANFAAAAGGGGSTTVTMGDTIIHTTASSFDDKDLEDSMVNIVLGATEKRR